MKHKPILLKSINKDQTHNKAQIETNFEEVHKPYDYRKVIGVTGIPNCGKSFLILQIGSCLSEYTKVAIIDNTFNQDLHFYFSSEDDSADDYIKINKNLFLYKLKCNDNFLSEIDNIKSNFDVVLIDFFIETGYKENKFYMNFNSDIVTYLDNLYIIGDDDITHTYVISNIIEAFSSRNVPLKKLKIIFNKVLLESDIKYLYNLLRYDRDNDILPKIDYNFVNFVCDKKIYKKFIQFDPEAYNFDPVFKSQIQSITNGMYLGNTKSTNIFKKLFK